MLNEEARRAASILHQTPGWRWRRELCLTERSQQRQNRPTTKAWRRLPARQRQTRVRHRQSTCTEHCQSCKGKGWRVRVAPPGACGLHRRNEIHAGVDSINSKSLADNRVAVPRDMRAAPLGDAQKAASERVRWHRQAASSGRVRVGALKLDRPIVRVLPVHNDGGVSRYRA